MVPPAHSYFHPAILSLTHYCVGHVGLEIKHLFGKSEVCESHTSHWDSWSALCYVMSHWASRELKIAHTSIEGATAEPNWCSYSCTSVNMTYWISIKSTNYTKHFGGVWKIRSRIINVHSKITILFNCWDKETSFGFFWKNTVISHAHTGVLKSAQCGVIMGSFIIRVERTRLHSIHIMRGLEKSSHERMCPLFLLLVAWLQPLFARPGTHLWYNAPNQH